MFSNIKTSFESQKLLISLFGKTDIKKIVFQIHPEKDGMTIISPGTSTYN